MKSRFGFIAKLACFLIFFGLCITMVSKGVTAYAAENEAKLNVKSVSIIKDGSYRLKTYNLVKGQSVLYRSSDTEVATVSRSGKVVGISYGTCIITATIVEGGIPVKTLQCDVLIGPAAVSIKLTRTELVLCLGKMKALKTIICPLNTVEKPVFYSENTSIAKVSSIGRVRAEGLGKVQVYVFISNGQYSVCDVFVLTPEDYETYLEGRTIEEILADLESEVWDDYGIEGAPETDESQEAAPQPESGDNNQTAGSEAEAQIPETSVPAEVK